MRFIFTNGTKSYISDGENKLDAEKNLRLQLGLDYIFPRGQTITIMPVCEKCSVAHADGIIHYEEGL